MPMIADNNLLTLLLLLLGLILLYLGWQAFRNPVLAKLGVRNIARRKTQTALITLGLTLSTVIIVAAFGTGDTITHSVRKQAVSAYGNVDEIIAPPLISMFTSMINTNASPSDMAAKSALQGLTKGGIDSILALVHGGLPSIGADRLLRLKQEVAGEPDIDAVAGAIFFPTIIRNVTTGRSEPLGFIFSPDDDYHATFGLTTVDGQPVTMTELETGVGTVFDQLARVTRLAPYFANLPEETATAGVAAAVGGMGMAGSVDSLIATINDLLTLDPTTLVGVNGAPLLTPESAATAKAALPPEAEQALAQVEALLRQQLGIDAADPQSTLNGLEDGALEMLRRINLATAGSQIDEVLRNYGLQMRQGELYLSQLGAKRLGARAGDLLEVFVGPMPVRFRVAAIVQEAGPISALMPVVMLRQSEAQALLFMQDKVNAVLVSNRGDELTGAELTGPVSRRLAVLAMDEAVVAELAAAINTPATLARLHEATAGLPEISLADGALLGTSGTGESMPGWLAGIAGGLASLMPPSASRTGVERFLTAVETGASPAELRELIGSGAIRDWLLTVRLPEESAATVADVVGRLNQFEQVGPLNKQTLMTTAQVGGGLFSTIFTIFGVFSILAAVLLIFLIVVMLAAERRTELGIARAIGVQRADVVKMFTYEGIVYALVAAAIGLPLGILVSWAMTQFMGKLLNDVSGTLSAQTAGLFGVEYHITGQSIAVAYCLGVVLTYAAIWWSARSASRLSITAAIRNLPDTAEKQRRHWTGQLGHWLVPLLILLLGAWLAGQGVNGSVSLFIMGISVALAGLGMLITRALALTAVRDEPAARITYTGVGAGLLLLWVPPWYAILPQRMPALFGLDMAQAPTVVTVGGPVIIAAAILTIMFNADAVNWLLTALLGFIPRIRPVLKTALSYPLADRFRTGMTMALFAMIMATVVVMAVIISTTAEMTAVDERTTGGFDIEVSSTLLSFFNPLADAATVIQAQPVDAYPKLAGIDTIGVFQDVSLVATSAQSADPLVRTTTFTAMNGDFARVSATVYPMAARAGGYDSDAAIWQALATQDDVVVVKKKLFAATAAGFPATELLAGGAQRSGESVAALTVGEGSKGGSLIRNPFAPFQLPNELLRGSQLADVYLELAASQGEGSRSRRVKVIGVLADDTTLAGGLIQGSDRLYAAIAAAPSSAPPNYLGSFFAGGERTVIKVAPGVAIDGVAGEIEKSLAGNGMDAAPLVEKFATAQNATRGVLQLLQGFMALGLLVGIAALGVVAARSVVERRQQIGVLRAIGFETNMVVGAFLLEASFISITGLLIGAVTGVVLGDNIVGVFFPMFTEAAVSIPWGQIAWLTFFAYFFAILVTISAAYQAAQIAPADALRYE